MACRPSAPASLNQAIEYFDTHTFKKFADVNHISAYLKRYSNRQINALGNLKAISHFTLQFPLSGIENSIIVKND